DRPPPLTLMQALNRIAEERSCYAAHTSSSVLSQDGRLLVFGDEDGRINVWTTKDRRFIRSVRVGMSQTRDRSVPVFVALSEDGKLLAASCGKRVQIIRTKDWQTQSTLEVDFDCKMTFSPDARLLLLATYDGQLSVRDTSSGKVLRRFEVHRQNGYPPLAI